MSPPNRCTDRGRSVTTDGTIDGRPGEPFNVLLNPDVQRLALRPKAEDESGTQTSSVVGLNDEHWVVLHRSLSNPSAPLRSLITRSQRAARPPLARPKRAVLSDQRGPVATKALKSQTRLSYPQRQKLLDACTSGMPVKQIAERFGIHRTTATRIVARTGTTVRNRLMLGD